MRSFSVRGRLISLHNTGSQPMTGSLSPWLSSMGVLCVTEDQELQEKFPGVAVSMDEFLKPQSDYVVREAKTSVPQASGVIASSSKFIIKIEKAM